MKENQQLPELSRWLIIETDVLRRVFVFKSGDEHTVVVGGTSTAHFHIRDTSPLCFYVERTGEQLRLVPGYVGNLRLNSQRVLESAPLPENSVVEFGRHRLQLSIRQVPPGQDDDTVFVPITPPPSALGEEQEEHDDGLVTRVASFDPNSQADEIPTAAITAPKTRNDTPAPVSDIPRVGGSILGTSYPEFDEEDPALVTQLMGSIPDFEENYPGYEPSASAVSAPESPASPSPPPSSNSPDTNTDRTEGIAFQDFVPPSGKSHAFVPNRVPPDISASPPRDDETSALELAPMATTEAKPGLHSPVVKKISGELERFGLWAKEKPLVAVGGGITCALLIGLAIGGISRAVSEATESSTTDQKPLPAASTPTAKTAPEPALAQVEGDTIPRVQAAKAPLEQAHENTDESEGEADSPEAEQARAEARAEARAAEEKAHSAQVNRAVEHLIAGRDDEAAHAYQSVAQSNFASIELKRISDLMERRRSAGHKKKPGSHEIPDLYR